MTELLEFLKVYKDYGVAGLFIALELFTVYFFYKELKSSKAESVAMTEKVITVADKSANAINEASKASYDTKGALDTTIRQNAEFIAFLRGRDDNHRRQRS